MAVNDTAKCHLIGIYKLPKSESKATIPLVQYTLYNTHEIPVTIPRVHVRFGPSAPTLKWAW